MALRFHGFSIRDYTSKMRSVDVFKCWPFPAAGLSRNQVESRLPPMSTPKLRRWSDELAELRSDLAGAGGTEERLNQRYESESEKEEEDKVELVCPVCQDFNASTLTAVNAHIDGCLTRTVREERQWMRRSKSKVPKRRSIAEIFELKEDMEEEKPLLPEIDTELKRLPFDEVSIMVTKFRWLSERLETLRSNGISFDSVKSVVGNSNSTAEEEESEMLCPVCRVFNSATVMAANTHINGCQATAMKNNELRGKPSLNNPKPKEPKKRSLADILTVTPQIDGDGKLLVEAEKDDEEIGEEFKKHGFSGARIKSKKSTNNNVTKKRKLKKVIMRKKNKVEKCGVVTLNEESKKINKKRKKKKKLNKEFTAKKGDVYKRKLQNSVHSFTKQGTVGNKKVKLDDIDASSALEKKLGLKTLSEENKEKVKNWDSVGKQQKVVVSPIGGILKNHKHIYGSTSIGSNIQDGTEETHCDVQVPPSDKHVRFSAEDSVLGPEKRSSFDETVFSLSSDMPASSFGEEKLTGNDEGTVNLEENRNGNTAINTDKRKEVCPMVESKQFSNTLGLVAVQNLLKPCTSEEKSKHLEEKSESLSNVTICDNNNLDRFDGGNTTTVHVSSYGDLSRSLSELQGGQSSGISTQPCESEAFSYTGKFIDHLGGPSFQSTNAHTRTYLEPSPSYSASCNEVNNRPEFPLHTYGNDDNNGQALGDRSLSGTFSADMIDNSFLLPGWGRGSIRNNCMEQNFYGLPLNSHGDLINFSSSGKIGMNQPETSCTLRSSLSGLPVNNVIHQSSQECLSIGKRHVVQKTLQDSVNPFPHYSGRLGVRELHGRERGDIYQHNSGWCSNHYVQPLDSELNLMRNPFIEQNQNQNQLEKVPNHEEYGMVSPRGSSGLVSPSCSQPTMRLMGKDVPIGRSSKEKQQFVGGVLWAEEESRRHYSVDAARDNSLLGRCYMPDSASGSQLQRQTENVFQSVKILSKQALQSTLLMNGPNSEFLNQRSNHISQNGSLGVSRNASTNLHTISQVTTSCAIYNRPPEDLPEQFISQGFCFHSQVSSNPCNFNQSTLSSRELNDWKMHHRVANSAFEFPFLHPIVEEHAKSSWFKRSYSSLAPWPLSSTHERPPGSSSSTSFPHNTWRNDSTISSVNHSSDVLYPPTSVATHCPRKTIRYPTSTAHPHPHSRSPYASVSPIIKPPSAIDSGCRNLFKVTDRVKFDDMSARVHHPCTNSRKRPSTSFVDPAKPNKLPNIEVKKNLTGMAVQQNTREVELDLQVGAIGKCCQNEAQNLNPRGFDSFNLDGVVISGPVKLSPGAKHILKPSQNQDNSTPVHSAIPIAVTTDCGKDLELQGNLTKMYII
ncbi:hypothetical protein AAZX31_08G300000 [Glycine max]